MKARKSTYGACVHAIADSRDDTTNYEMFKREGAALKNGTNRHDDRPNKDGLTAPEDIAYEDRAASSQKTTKVVRGNGDTFDKSGQNHSSMA